MNNNEFLYNELQKQCKDIYISGSSMDLLMVYIENRKDNIYKAYLFKFYPFNMLDYKIIPLTKPFNLIYDCIKQSKFKNYCFYEENIKNIAIGILELYKYDGFIYRKTLKKAYRIALASIESLIVDYEVIRNQKTIIKEIANNNIGEVIYLNEILK